MPEKIWINLGWNGNSVRHLMSIRYDTDEQQPLDIDDLKLLCQQQLRECKDVGKAQMTVFTDDQAIEGINAGLGIQTLKEKYPDIGKTSKPFVIIISASGDSFL